MNMQPIVGAFPDGDWDFSRMFSTEDQLEFTPEFLAQYAFPVVDSSQFGTPSSTLSSNPDEEMNMAGLEESLFCSWNALNSNLEFISQENSNSSNSGSSVFFPSFSNETYFFGYSNHIPTTNESSMSMDICMMDEKNGGSFNPVYPQIAMTETGSEDMGSDKKASLDDQSQALGDAVSCNEQQLKRKLDVQESKANPSESTKKRARVTRANKGKKNAQSKKNQKAGEDNNDEEDNNGQSSSGFSSEDENASQDSNGGANSDSKALNSNGKTRASRGSATDAQSLYARKRRERINERLRILQNLVPNGTKVDISTMLEEAVHYVKFLQIQIKLLSSDDLWMFAPIAYNGVDIGLNQKFSTLL